MPMLPKKMSTIALAGGRAFFVPACFTDRGNIMTEVVTEKRTAGDVYDDLTLKMGHIHSLLDIMGECDKGSADMRGAAFGIQSMVEDAKGLAEELYHAANGGAK